MRKHRISYLVMALTLGCALFAGTLAQASGYYYEATKTTVGPTKKQNDSMKVLGWVDGDQAKVQFVSREKDNPFANGNYLVTQDGGETVYLVNPGDKTYAEFNLEEMMAVVGQVANTLGQMGGLVKAEFSDVSNEKLLEEPSAPILGLSTTHYRYQSRYTMKVKVMGFGQRTTTDTIQDLWLTTDINSRGFGVWLQSECKLKTGNDEFDKLLDQEMSKITGFPLKTVSVSTMTNKKGKARTVTSITQILVLREESISGYIFGWPADYTETQIMPAVQSPEGGNQQALNSKPKKKKGRLSSLFD